MVARAVRDACWDEWRRDGGHTIAEVDPNAVIAALPEAAPLPAPTGPGWWWAHFAKESGFVEGWKVLRVSAVGTKLFTEHRDWLDAADAWVGPLAEPAKEG
jgi:hypothetical protein